MLYEALKVFLAQCMVFNFHRPGVREQGVGCDRELGGGVAKERGGRKTEREANMSMTYKM